MDELMGDETFCRKCGAEIVAAAKCPNCGAEKLWSGSASPTAEELQATAEAALHAAADVPADTRLFWFRGQLRFGCPKCTQDYYEPDQLRAHVKWTHR